jgi:CBS domain containing-hemolysin-like protein
MKPGVHYVHEDQTLYRVLHAFLTTKQHIFTVIDSDERYVGIITIEDVLEQVIGHKFENGIEDGFDSYDDKKAVAASALKSVPAADVSNDHSHDASKDDPQDESGANATERSPESS